MPWICLLWKENRVLVVSIFHQVSALLYVRSYVVINILFRCRSVFQDVIVIPMINDQNAAGFEQSVKVGNGYFVFLLITVKVGQMGERITHYDNGIISLISIFTHIIFESEPISLFDD